MSINWGGYDFESIKLLESWDPPSYSGIYAIMFQKDLVAKPYT